MRTRKKRRGQRDFVFDVQSKLESDMHVDKNMMAVKAMLINDRVLNSGPLNAFNLLVNFTSTHNLSGRSEDARNGMTSFNFLMSLKHVGNNGMKATCNVLSE